MFMPLTKAAEARYKPLLA